MLKNKVKLAINSERHGLLTKYFTPRRLPLPYGPADPDSRTGLFARTLQTLSFDCHLLELLKNALSGNRFKGSQANGVKVA